MKRHKHHKLVIALFLLFIANSCRSDLSGPEEKASPNNDDPRSFFESSSIPDAYALYPPYPNPFRPAPFAATMNIQFALPMASAINLRVQNPVGDVVKVLMRGQLQAGYHVVQWNGTNKANESVKDGLYFVTLESGSFIQSHLVKIERQ